MRFPHGPIAGFTGSVLRRDELVELAALVDHVRHVAHEEMLDGAYMTPTYGNTLMGLAASAPSGPHNNYKIAYYAPEPRAVIEVVDFDDPTKLVEYGRSGRVKLTTLTKEFFMPGFLERDEGEREPPYERYPWDGVSGVRPFRGFAATTTVGVY